MAAQGHIFRGRLVSRGPCVSGEVSEKHYCNRRTVFGAFKDEKLVGFSSVESELFGEKQEYLQLSSLHVSNEQRGGGIGKTLFQMSADRAGAMGAKKLYISAHSSQETQAFYESTGCSEAVEYNRILCERNLRIASLSIYCRFFVLFLIFFLLIIYR